MRLFIDGEWNSYRGDLISLALVAEDGREFYEVLGCATPEPWVAENVIPVLGKDAIKRSEFNVKLDDFLRGCGAFTVIADWPEDIEHFCRALVVGPGERIGPDSWNMQVIRLPSNVAQSSIPHNALEDARAIAKYLIGLTRGTTG